MSRPLGRIPFANGRTMAVAARHDGIVLLLEGGAVPPRFVIAHEAIAPLLDMLDRYVGRDVTAHAPRWDGESIRPPGVPRGRVHP